MTNTLEVKDLRVELSSGRPVLEGVSLAVGSGQILGVVGESGSGKTTLALALLGYARPGMRIAAGAIRIAGEQSSLATESAARRVRGRLVSYVPQDPDAALNPSRRIGDLVRDMLTEHVGPVRDPLAITAAFGRVDLPQTTDFARRYPHQLSGGQQQRVAIAIALVCEPPLLILDEPTTGLDVITQASVLGELARLRDEQSLSMVYVSHDLAVVASLADRIAVMYGGVIVEEGSASRVLDAPRHPYTRALLSSIPDHREPRILRGIPGIPTSASDNPPGCVFAPRCEYRVERCTVERPPVEATDTGSRVRCFEWRTISHVEARPHDRPARLTIEPSPILQVKNLRATHVGRYESVVAAEDISFDVGVGECVALVGESGSGKTTIARCLAGLHEPTSGTVLLDGTALAPRAKNRPREARRRIQIIFQNPYESLNPRHRVLDAVARPARVLRGLSASESAQEAHDLLNRVRLPARLGEAFPGELSGGERQRVAVARALAARPDLIICDEITSALDVSVQAALLELLSELRVDFASAFVFISHDLGVVASVADRVLVLERGVLREEGRVDEVLSAPRDPYTQRLLDAAPRPVAVGS